jgi:hypothetical protein
MEDHPRKSYPFLMAAYASLFAIVASRLRRDPTLLAQTPAPRDLVLLGLASFQLTRLINYDKVTSPLRAPFVDLDKGPLHPEGTRGEAKGSGLQYSIGQLLTCSLCMSAWAGAFNVYLLTLAPRFGRLFLLIVASTGMSQMLNPLFELLMKVPGLVEKSEQVAKQAVEHREQLKSGDGVEAGARR